MENMELINLTDDTLKNILLMAPMLDEIGQNRVFGLMCGLLQGVGQSAKPDIKQADSDQRTGW